MAMAAVGAVGLAIFYTLFSGLLLFTKNSAMNVSHEEARVALLELDQDLHSAVSLPELTDSNANLIAARGGPGVEFQELVQPSQYCQVTANAVAGASGSPSGSLPAIHPDHGHALIIPSYQVEQNINAISISGTVPPARSPQSSLGHRYHGLLRHLQRYLLLYPACLLLRDGGPNCRRW